MSAIVSQFQKTLKAAGLYRGTVDGDFGPLTLAASMQYFPGAPPWLYVAAQELGVSEILGRRHNPRILEYHKATTLAADSDEVAWCASFVNWCLGQANMRGTGSAAAASFDHWGEGAALQMGAIITIPTNTGSKRHVAFCVGWYGGYFFHLGGNQSNRVNVQATLRSKLTAVRWPLKS